VNLEENMVAGAGEKNPRRLTLKKKKPKKKGKE